MEKRIAMIMVELASARTFEHACVATLSCAIDLVNEVLGSSKYATTGRLVRALVHIRPDDGYRHLAVLDANDNKLRTRVDPADLPSVTTWRWVKQHDSPVFVDVDLSRVEVRHSQTAASFKRTSERFEATQSRIKLQGRHVTHLYVAPLRAPGGRINGMLVLEADCPAARGTHFIWEGVETSLLIMATLASPYLSELVSGQEASDVAPSTTAAIESDDFLPVIGKSMREIIHMLRVFAQQEEETILLGGPTGAGKSRLARWCHAQSTVRDQPFETINLATVPEDLQMAELFGWEKGAFTGAAHDAPGCISRADRGTLFIDEVDKLSLKAQAGLLRVLDEKKYRRLGGREGDRMANVRFIVGTNANLRALSQKSIFREDLYYRINVLPVKIPPLRERSDEIAEWAAYMVRRRHEQSKLTCEAVLAADAVKRLEAHDWPGNLRQLDNIIRRAYTLALAYRASNSENLVLSSQHIDRALTYEGCTSPQTAFELMERAAEALVIEAERRRDSNEEKLDLDVAEALKGLTLDVAKRRFGHDEKEALRRAFSLMGKDAMVEGRNHSASYKREMEKVQEARRRLKVHLDGATSEREDKE